MCLGILGRMIIGGPAVGRPSRTADDIYGCLEDRVLRSINDTFGFLQSRDPGLAMLVLLRTSCTMRPRSDADPSVTLCNHAESPIIAERWYARCSHLRHCGTAISSTPWASAWGYLTSKHHKVSSGPDLPKAKLEPQTWRLAHAYMHLARQKE